jgi:hypothetical protein
VALQDHIFPPPVPPQVGTLPPGFNPNLDTYHRSDVIRLMIFYNETFAIRANDLAADWIGKLRVFFTAD